MAHEVKHAQESYSHRKKMRKRGHIQNL
uniref:Uncharacterized protein n=1 Tax=Arundo donax TaxID=35708 RepID=A0A0A9H9M6_ARUDO